MAANAQSPAVVAAYARSAAAPAWAPHSLTQVIRALPSFRAPQTHRALTLVAECDRRSHHRPNPIGIVGRMHRNATLFPDASRLACGREPTPLLRRAAARGGRCAAARGGRCAEGGVGSQPTVVWQRGMPAVKASLLTALVKRLEIQPVLGAEILFQTAEVTPIAETRSPAA